MRYNDDEFAEKQQLSKVGRGGNSRVFHLVYNWYRSLAAVNH